ncbi:Hypp9335 [Branchiostoma lanceolatum]|nr:Hypp9335 [Branchiostoma lanceolatum]
MSLPTENQVHVYNIKGEQSTYVPRLPNHARQTSPGGARLWPMTGKISPPVGDDLRQAQPCDPAAHTIYNSATTCADNT